MLSPLENLRVLITGASSGIGEATARALHERGAKLTLVARRQDKLAAMNLANVKLLVADVTSSDFLSQIDLNSIDVLINNAGLALGKDPVEKLNWADAEIMLKTNVDAALRLASAVVPGMLARGSGDILNLCSIAGHWTYQGGAIYCASKHALWAFTRALREETAGRNVRVMQVSPGMVETDFSLVRFKGDAQTAKSVYQGMTPLTPQDIARQIVFMLEQPRHVCIDEITSMPTDQGSPTTIRRHP